MLNNIINGIYWDNVGKNFEKFISSNLNYTNNEKNPILNMFIDKTKIDLCTVDSIKAYTDKEHIGRLLSGGNPKTDVLVEIIKNNKCYYETISCKKTSKNSVTVHQYSADAFADILDKENIKLRRLLNIFQKYGNKRDLPKGVAEDLENELKPHKEKLIKWVISGEGGTDNKKHIANYIITNKKGTINIHSVKEYCQKLLNENKMFGTPFQWTYQSKGKGKSIQLKVPIF